MMGAGVGALLGCRWQQPQVLAVTTGSQWLPGSRDSWEGLLYRLQSRWAQLPSPTAWQGC